MGVPDGIRRVYANAGVSNMRAQEWNDVIAGHPQLDEWINAGLVSDVGPNGEGPPDTIRRRCCGG